jgi:eukaryotic-like serine/threonine-protein kinase
MRAIAELHTGLLLQGRYRLHSELGTGSSSRVYLAADVRLHRPVAVKILHPALSDDETFVRRFRLEARAAASLNHPNIVHVYDWGSDNEGFYVVLEYLAGGSLRDLLANRHTLSVAQAASIGMAIAQALAFAHERGIVHRDIKPANLLFDESGTPHLADFGLAKALSEASWTEPNGLVLGTVRYASPEQALGQHLDDRSDVYSLGLVLYEAVTGRAPFAGDSLHALLLARVRNPLPRSPELGALASVVDAATRPERAERLSAAELATRLERVVHGLGAPDPIPLVIGPSVTDPPDAGRAAPADHSSDESTAFDDVTILDASRRSDAAGSADSTAIKPGADGQSERGARRQTRRRRVARAASAAVALVLIAAVATISIARYVVFTHVIPNVVHQQLSSARGEVSAHGLRLRVASRVFSSQVPEGMITKESPRPGIRERGGVTVDVVVSRGPAMVSVPTLVGLSKTDAVNRLTKDHLVAVVSSSYNETVPVGDVVRASPSTGVARLGSKVGLSVSLGPHPRTIPQFASTTYLVASTQLKRLKLTPIEHFAYSNAVPSGDVVSTDPAEGATGVKVGSEVSVLVSRGPRLIAVPSVANLPIPTAIQLLRQHGLVVNEQIGPPFSTRATTTNPGPGTEVRIGTAVTLYVA